MQKVEPELLCRIAATFAELDANMNGYVEVGVDIPAPDV